MGLRIAMGGDENVPTLTRRRKVETAAEKAERLAKAQAVLSAHAKMVRKARGGNRLDDLEFLMLTSLSFGLVVFALTVACGFLYFHFEGVGRPIIHAGDAPQYELCDRLSQVGLALLFLIFIWFMGLKCMKPYMRNL